MPSDFGDESGEKLVDWMRRGGEDMGDAAMQASAKKLQEAFRNAREGVTGAEGADAPGQQGREWARLNMREFSELPEYESIKQVIDESLHREALEHSFATVEDREYLVFKVADAPAVATCFEQLERQTELAASKAAEGRAKALDRGREAIDAEPLEEKAKAAKEASRHMEAAKSKAREAVRQEMRSK